MRWCTAMLKLKPFEDWVEAEFHGCLVKSYVAIRADEDLAGPEESNQVCLGFDAKQRMSDELGRSRFLSNRSSVLLLHGQGIGQAGGDERRPVYRRSERWPMRVQAPTIDLTTGASSQARRVRDRPSPGPDGENSDS